MGLSLRCRSSRHLHHSKIPAVGFGVFSFVPPSRSGDLPMPTILDSSFLLPLVKRFNRCACCQAQLLNNLEKWIIWYQSSRFTFCLHILLIAYRLYQLIGAWQPSLYFFLPQFPQLYPMLRSSVISDTTKTNPNRDLRENLKSFWFGVLFWCVNSTLVLNKCKVHLY